MEHDDTARSLDQPVQADISDGVPRRSRRSIWLVVVAVVFVLVVYPLSYGPVMYQVSMGRLVGLWPVFDVIYAPIEWFATSSEFGEELVDWYLGVCGA